MLIKTRKTIYALIFALLCVLGLSACSTGGYSSSSKYPSNYRAYQPVNLPADYPTKYLPNGNLWDDFRKNLQLPVDTSNRRVQEQIVWIRNHQDFINRSLVRGAQYFHYIYQQTKIRRLPPELALIPVYESGYMPVGRSNKGAVGLWQFMPGTAAGYGLRMDRWYDGRRDVVSSTNAAMKYFAYLHYFFNDWLLAIAAYDHGEGNVQAAILRNKRRGLRADYWNLSVPRETHVYVPQLLALAAVIKNPAKYGVTLVPINNGPYFEQVNVGKSIEINKYARLAGVDVNLMRSLNAGYLRTTMDPDGPYALLVPRSKVAIFKARVSGKSVPATVEKESVALEQKSEGDNNAVNRAQIKPQAQQAVVQHQANEENGIVSRTLLKHSKRLLMEEQSQLNKNINANNAERVESNANSADDSESNSNDEDDSNDDSTSKNYRAGGGAGAAAAAAAAGGALNTIPYRVAKGDNVYNVAKKFKIDEGKLKKVNRLNGNNLKIGKIIKIPYESKVAKNTKTTEVTKGQSKVNKKKVSVSQGNVAQKSKQPSDVIKTATAKVAKVSGGSVKVKKELKPKSKPTSSVKNPVGVRSSRPGSRHHVQA